MLIMIEQGKVFGIAIAAVVGTVGSRDIAAVVGTVGSLDISFFGHVWEGCLQTDSSKELE
jgi:hypothetical protein